MTTKRPISTVQTVTRRSGWLLGAAGVLAVVALGVGQSLVGDVTVVEAQGKEAQGALSAPSEGLESLAF